MAVFAMADDPNSVDIHSDEANKKKQWKLAGAHIHFITGRLAERALRGTVQRLAHEHHFSIHERSDADYG
jgi:hypothetical protein